jgi:PAS domain S-box-containing protein
VNVVDKRYRVLLVESDPRDRRLSEEFFVRNDMICRGEVAPGLEKAKAALAAGRYDVVVTDCLFPDGTAFDILPFLREAPVIFMAKGGKEEAASMAFKAEACEYLVKDADGGHLKVLMLTIVRAVSRKRAERELQMLSEAVRTIDDAVFVSDMEGNIVFVNAAFCRVYGYESREALRENVSSLWRIPCGDLSEVWRGETVHQRKGGVIFPAEYSRTLLKDGEEGVARVVHVVRDVTEKKMIESEKEQLISELRDALGNVKKLSGLLPICANCKNIRDERGGWNTIETYIAKNSEANFTHGVCPECTRELYPEYADELTSLASGQRD